MRLLTAVLAMLLAAGCGGGGSDGEGASRPASPEYDLTGIWYVAPPVDCEVFTDNLTAREMAELGFTDLNMFVEQSFLANNQGTRINHDGGSHLDIAALGSGVQLEGTVSGNQIRYEYSESGPGTLGLDDADYYAEFEGTILDPDRMAMVVDDVLTFGFGDFGMPLALESSCSYTAVRSGA